MLIEITQEDIDKGQVGDNFNCPIALALKRSFKGKDFSVIGDSVRKRDSYTRIPLPETASSFIRSFDRQEKVSPLTFELEINEDGTTPIQNER